MKCDIFVCESVSVYNDVGVRGSVCHLSAWEVVVPYSRSSLSIQCSCQRRRGVYLGNKNNIEQYRNILQARISIFISLSLFAYQYQCTCSIIYNQETRDQTSY